MQKKNSPRAGRRDSGLHMHGLDTKAARKAVAKTQKGGGKKEKRESGGAIRAIVPANRRQHI